MFDQQRDVFRPLGQRGQVDFHNVEPVKEIRTKAPRFDLVPQVSVSRGDDAHVHRNGFRPTDRDDFPLFDRSK